MPDTISTPMRSVSRIAPLVAAVVVCAAFAYGVVTVFTERFARGDTYPPHSSLRADPLGCKVLHDSLLRLRGIAVARNSRPLSELPDPRRTVLLMIGATSPVPLIEGSGFG